MNAPQESDVLPLPNGWFAVEWSHALAEAEVKAMRRFGHELVLFRSRSGKPHLLDAYCAHLGAHLGVGGRVMGETIRCPFHAWRYDGAGRCVEIPYCQSIPPKAKVRSWEVVERNGMIFAWHHAEEKPPDWEVPTIPEIGHPDWTEPRCIDIEVPVHLQELAENNCDPIHFEFVHGMADVPPSEIQFAEDGRFFRMSGKGQRETPAGTFETELVRDTFGLGLSTVRVEGIPGVGTMLFASSTPVDADHTIMRWSLAVTRNIADEYGEEFMSGIVKGVDDDIPIWTHKIHRAKPVLCETDGYIAEFRRWTRQFYSDAAASAED